MNLKGINGSTPPYWNAIAFGLPLTVFTILAPLFVEDVVTTTVKTLLNLGPKWRLRMLKAAYHIFVLVLVGLSLAALLDKSTPQGLLYCVVVFAISHIVMSIGFWLWKIKHYRRLNWSVIWPYYSLLVLNCLISLAASFSKQVWVLLLLAFPFYGTVLWRIWMQRRGTIHY